MLQAPANAVMNQRSLVGPLWSIKPIGSSDACEVCGGVTLVHVTVGGFAEVSKWMRAEKGLQ